MGELATAATRSLTDPLAAWAAQRIRLDGQTEEQIRAEAQAEVRRLIDAFVESVKEHVCDEEIRERIRRTILEALPSEEDGGAGDSGDEIIH